MSECQKKRKVRVSAKLFKNLSSRAAVYFTLPSDVSLNPQEEIEIINEFVESGESLVARILNTSRFKSIEEMLANLGNQILYLGLGRTKEKILDYYTKLNPKYLERMQHYGITLYAVHVIDQEVENVGETRNRT